MLRFSLTWFKAKRKSLSLPFDGGGAFSFRYQPAAKLLNAAVDVDVDIGGGAEHTGDLVLHSGHDDTLEQSNQTDQQQGADDNSDQDLHASVNVSLSGLVSDRIASGDQLGIKLLHGDFLLSDVIRFRAISIAHFLDCQAIGSHACRAASPSLVSVWLVAERITWQPLCTAKAGRRCFSQWRTSGGTQVLKVRLTSGRKSSQLPAQGL